MLICWGRFCFRRRNCGMPSGLSGHCLSRQWLCVLRAEIGKCVCVCVSVRQKDVKADVWMRQTGFGGPLKTWPWCHWVLESKQYAHSVHLCLFLCDIRLSDSLPSTRVGQLAILAFKPWWKISCRNMMVSLNNINEMWQQKDKRDFTVFPWCLCLCLQCN